MLQNALLFCDHIIWNKYYLCPSHICLPAETVSLCCLSRWLTNNNIVIIILIRIISKIIIVALYHSFYCQNDKSVNVKLERSRVYRVNEIFKALKEDRSMKGVGNHYLRALIFFIYHGCCYYSNDERAS